MTSISFLSAFNAKAMSYEQVASSFVSSVKFAELAGQWNALLVGPRGSGKTTLLRMLSLEGMRSWSGAEANRYRSELNYTGIYVPADIAWGEMVNALGNGNLDRDTLDLVSEAAFATNVFMSTINTLQLRLQPSSSGDPRSAYRAVSIERGSAEEVVRAIAELWKLQPRSLSFRSLGQALAMRLMDIHQQCRLLARDPDRTRMLVLERMPYLGLPVIECVDKALTFFDNETGEQDAKWALLLDELEVAPASLQRDVLVAMRAAAPKLLYKLALAPCGRHTLFRLNTETPPTQRHDYRQVLLWYVDKDEADSFCEKVFEARTANDPLLNNKSPRDVFGESPFSIVEDDVTYGSYPYGKDFASLLEKDSSFRDYIVRKAIDISNLNPSPNAPNGNTIRKIAPLVAFRNAYRGNEDGKKRGRKPFNAAYAGWAAIAAISEGNPRWLLTLLTGIFAGAGASQTLPVPYPTQQHHAVKTSGTFADVLRTVATRQFDCIQTSIPVMELLTRIGNYFHSHLVTDNFVEDPPLAFDVGDEIDEDVENSLRIALNHGAIICYEAPDGLGGFGTLKNKRFRLSYTLSPSFKLPIRKSKPHQLTTILNPQSDVSPKRKYSAGDEQGRLF